MRRVYSPDGSPGPIWAIKLAGWWYVFSLDMKCVDRVDDPYTSVSLDMWSKPLK